LNLLLVNDGKEKNEGDVRKILIARTVKLAKNYHSMKTTISQNIEMSKKKNSLTTTQHKWMQWALGRTQRSHIAKKNVAAIENCKNERAFQNSDMHFRISVNRNLLRTKQRFQLFTMLQRAAV
jgi:hypothetical protein